MGPSPRGLTLSREQILAFRRRVGALDARLPMSPESLRVAGWAGLQDSMPRAALLSIHARVSGATSSSWEDPAFVQIWGPRYSTYVVPAEDLAVFTLGRLPDDPRGLGRATATADRLEEVLAGRRMTDRAAAALIDVFANSFRYAGPSGRALIRWEGARAPVVWMVPAPAITPREASMELARRYLHVFGPTTPASFATWAGMASAGGPKVFAWLAEAGELMPVTTPIGDAWILPSDEAAMRAPAGPPAPARLLPSGDTFFLCWGADRTLLVQDARRREQLWTSRVWPGALLVAGELAGTWRRANEKVTIEPWRRLRAAEREAVEAEATALPLLALTRPISVTWSVALPARFPQHGSWARSRGSSSAKFPPGG